jgi:deoxycytidine triphosphate deaminase
VTEHLVDAEMLNHNILTDHDLEALVASQKIIDPFDIEQLSGCSYDLRAGKTLRSRNRGRTFNLARTDYEIESGECVTFETFEIVNFRRPLLFGFVVNKHSILAKGLVHPITKIDPGFSGPLAITLFNHGSTPEPIRFKQPLVSLVVFPLGAEPKRIYGTSKPPSYREGSLDIASVINERAEPLDDPGLARMYGRPVSRLYERVGELERSIEAGLIKQRRERRARGTDIIWRFAVGFFGAVVALVGKYLYDLWTAAP